MKTSEQLHGAEIRTKLINELHKSGMPWDKIEKLIDFLDDIPLEEYAEIGGCYGGYISPNTASIIDKSGAFEILHCIAPFLDMCGWDINDYYIIKRIKNT